MSLRPEYEPCVGHIPRSSLTRGAPRGEGPGPPWYLKNTIFSGFLPLNYVICIFEVCFLRIFAMW